MKLIHDIPLRFLETKDNPCYGKQHHKYTTVLTNGKNPISRQPMSYDQTPQIEPILKAVTKRAVLQGHLRAKGAGVLDGALGIDLRWGAPLDPP